MISDVIKQFDLSPLLPVLRTCVNLANEDSFLDVAVLGQFNSGKSSLLNAILGDDVFPVGILPATAVVTRARAGKTSSATILYLNGTAEEISTARMSEFVTEARNPGNSLRVAFADVSTPALSDWQGIRLVDTPGLGSFFVHNTLTTQDWLPDVAVALVVVSAERPFSDEDRRLLDEARQHAGRVAVVLNKVDLLSAAEQQELVTFVDHLLRENCKEAIPLLLFSSRADREHYVRGLKKSVFEPLIADVAGRRRESLAHKSLHLIRSCRGYLEVGLDAAQRADADRDRLRAAVLDESVNEAMIRDELHLAEQRVCASTRSAFESAFLSHRATLIRSLADRLTAELPTWRGNLAKFTNRYELWLTDELLAALSPLSSDAAPLAVDLLGQAEQRFRRIVEAFRDRLSRNIREATGVSVSLVAWEACHPQVAVITVQVGRTFMTNWELLWWMLPMPLIGGIVRRHALHRLPEEVEKNLFRLTADWSAAFRAALEQLVQLDTPQRSA